MPSRRQDRVDEEGRTGLQCRSGGAFLEFCMGCKNLRVEATMARSIISSFEPWMTSISDPVSSNLKVPCDLVDHR